MAMKLLRRLPDLNRATKRAILVSYDLVAMAIALWGAFSTRLGVLFVPDNPRLLLWAALSFAIGIVALYRLRIYHIVLRYFDMRTVTRIFAGAAIAAASWVIVIYFTRDSFTVNGLPTMVPRSVGFIYCGFLFLLLFMGRYVMALLLAGAGRNPAPAPHARRKVIIYGANAAGISLADSMMMTRQYRLIGFVDDDPALHGQIVAGVPIHSPDALQDLAAKGSLDEVFLALPHATRSQRLGAIGRVSELNLKAKTVPAPEEIVSGRFTISDVRPIDVADLLRRDSVQPMTELIREAVDGHTILVTGAGGSIGSEICRQILLGRPRRIVLLDHSEFALYAVDQLLADTLEKLPDRDRPEIVPIVGSTLSEALVRNLIRDHEVDSIYHAAAYKHVPLLEHNEVVGVENNVIGTLSLARVALEARLRRFTMISTDKAVRPRSVMGASKRVAELVVQAFAEEPECRTRFAIVRFGNVLDSSGSVVQRFRRQIGQGGPVTVTHREVTRYFMSIPEATQLVLQASAMAHKGEVFVLDMGQPVKIDDLARHMIALSGMSVRDERNPTGDIEISYVGLRPGEKLHEELFLGEDVVETAHPRIWMAKERSLTMTQVQPHVDELIEAIAAGHAGHVRRKLREVLKAEAQNEPGRLEGIDDLRQPQDGVVTPFERRGKKH